MEWVGWLDTRVCSLAFWVRDLLACPVMYSRYLGRCDNPLIIFQLLRGAVDEYQISNLGTNLGRYVRTAIVGLYVRTGVILKG